MHSLRLVRSTLHAAILLVATAATAASADSPAEHDEVVLLPRFEVRESGARITDFGMSIVTNFAVLFGGKIAWMRVGTVVPGSSAALLGLAKDDRIALIDGTKITDVSRSQMLHIFFHRKSGEKVKLLVCDERTKRWHLVELSASPHRIAP